MKKTPTLITLLGWLKANPCKKQTYPKKTDKALCFRGAYLFTVYASPHHNICLFWLITSAKVTCSLPYFIIPAPDTGRWPDSSSIIRCLLLSSPCLTFIECPVGRGRKQGEEKQCNFTSPLQLGCLCIPYFTAPYLSSSA